MGAVLCWCVCSGQQLRAQRAQTPQHARRDGSVHRAACSLLLLRGGETIDLLEQVALETGAADGSVVLALDYLVQGLVHARPQALGGRKLGPQVFACRLHARRRPSAHVVRLRKDRRLHPGNLGKLGRQGVQVRDIRKLKQELADEGVTYAERL